MAKHSPAGCGGLRMQADKLSPAELPQPSRLPTRTRELVQIRNFKPAAKSMAGPGLRLDETKRFLCEDQALRRVLSCQIVKTVRILLIVLLAVLLPVRGALAGAGHCAGSKDFTQAIAAAHVHTEVPQHGEQGDEHADTGHAPHHSSSTDTEQYSASGDPCTVCTATCSATSLLSEPLTMVSPIAMAGTSFPALIAPPPSHTAEGPERPPRSA